MSVISNDEAIELFKKIEQIKENKNLSPLQIEKEIKDIRSEIVNKLSFLVYSSAKSYKKFPNYEDLVQEGLIGLFRATRKFNYTKFPNFFLYANRWIRNSIKRSASHFDVVYNPNRNRVIYAEVMKDDDNNDPEDINTPEEIYFVKETKKKIREVLNEFPERDKEIIIRIFGLNSNIPETLREIGPDYNITHERIRQIKNNVMSKLKKNQILNEIY